MFICQNLIVVRDVIFNGSRVEKRDGKKDGDQMQITKKRLKQIISEELDRNTNIAKNKSKKINEIVSILNSLNEVDLNKIHENLTRNK